MKQMKEEWFRVAVGAIPTATLLIALIYWPQVILAFGVIAFCAGLFLSVAYVIGKSIAG